MWFDQYYFRHPELLAAFSLAAQAIECVQSKQPVDKDQNHQTFHLKDPLKCCI